MKIVLASRNPHKTREFAELLGPEFEISDLTAARGIGQVAETGATFEENAIVKAETVSQFLPDKLVLADDSGLEVDALGGAPGVRSARYAGGHATDAENIDKLLRKLRETRGPRRSARFRCVIALCRDGRLLHTAGGEVCGSIAEEPRGTNGFGYDPIFVPHGLDKTFAELPADFKNKISHRAIAAGDLRSFLALQLR